MNKKPLKKNKIILLLKKIKKINLKNEKIKILETKERISSNTIVSNIEVPPFKNSAVDGYALSDKQLYNNKSFKITYRITAGQKNKFILKKGEAARIFTGAKMPLNSSTVVMQENVEKFKNTIEVKKLPRFGENCRNAGEDIAKGSVVINKGQKINTNNISLLAAIGKRSIKVRKKLQVGYFTSGNELLNPSESLSGSKINNSNKYALSFLLNKNYLKSQYLGNLKDSKKNILNLLMKHVNNYSVIITTGGASVGEEDHLIDIIKERGKLFFWKIAIKPGRPLAIGIIKNTYFICLPGNPVSVYLLFGMIINNFLEYLCGSKMKNVPYYYATVDFSMRKKTNRLEWLRVKINKNHKNFFYVSKFPKQGSGIISSISSSDGIIEIPENISQINKGDRYKFYSFSDLFNPL